MTRLRPNLTFLACLAWAVTAAAAPPALAWDPFRSENRDVRRGNEHLQKGQLAEATEAYETAARKLPKDAGVQLNRGLSLMASDKLDAARDAFKLATQGNASKDVRAQSYYGLGLAFMRQAEAASKADKLDEAQGFLRESVDSFKSSLRNGPRNADAAWNLELARRRLADVQKSQDEKKKDEEKDKEKDKEKDGEEQEKDEGQKKDDATNKDDAQKQQGQQKQEGEQQDDASKAPGDKPEPNDDQKGKKPEAEQPPRGDSPADQDGQRPPAGDTPAEEEGASQRPLPKPMEQALDALSHGEENMEKVRARMRAARQPRRVQKDW